MSSPVTLARSFLHYPYMVLRAPLFSIGHTSCVVPAGTKGRRCSVHGAPVFWYLAAGKLERHHRTVWDCHHPKFDIDEESLATGIEITVAVTTTFLSQP